MGKNILELIYLKYLLENEDGELVDDLLPGLKRVDPTIESIEMYLYRVTRDYKNNNKL